MVMSITMMTTFVVLSLELGLAMRIFALPTAEWTLAIIILNA
jgi:hypothetical protein